MSNPTIPSRSPANTNSLSGLLSVVVRKSLESRNGQLPAKVLAYDRSLNRATVQPLIDVVLTSGDVKPRPQIASVPVLSLGGGGFCINFPLVAGDIGWIEASDRDISLFIQSLSEAKPNTFRIHSFEDGLFIPDAFRKYSFDSGDDSASMVIQSYDGSVKISLSPTGITLKAPTSITLESALISLKAGALTMTDISGGGTGTATISNPVVMSDGLTVNGKKVEDHYHNGVQTGAGNTSTMIGGT